MDKIVALRKRKSVKNQWYEKKFKTEELKKKRKNFSNIEFMSQLIKIFVLKKPKTGSKKELKTIVIIILTE